LFGHVALGQGSGSGREKTARAMARRLVAFSPLITLSNVAKVIPWVPSNLVRSSVIWSASSIAPFQEKVTGVASEALVSARLVLDAAACEGFRSAVTTCTAALLAGAAKPLLA